MFHTLYNIGLHLFGFILKIAAVFHAKARLWCDGRKGLLSDLQKWRTDNPGELMWIHCASLGEFEQGRPLIEAMREEKPERMILLTFFSPSGYEIRKNYAHANHVCYLPLDTPANAKRFLEIVRPSVVFFVKYEYWANYFFQCKKAEIPLYIISGILRQDQRFFGLFKSFWKNVLACVAHFYVQNVSTAELLRSIGFVNSTVAGDTRFDRVLKLSTDAKHFEEFEKFVGSSFCVVGGSTWPQEEAMLATWFQRSIKTGKNYKLILVPHEITPAHIHGLLAEFPEAECWTKREGRSLSEAHVLIVDTIGMLAGIYQYGHVAVIGGGFGKGIHNTLEAAVWSRPVFFGPKHQKFEEAIELKGAGGGFSFSDGSELSAYLDRCATDTAFLNESGRKAGAFVKENVGATKLIMSGLNAAR